MALKDCIKTVSDLDINDVEMVLDGYQTNKDEGMTENDATKAAVSGVLESISEEKSETLELIYETYPELKDTERREDGNNRTERRIDIDHRKDVNEMSVDEKNLELEKLRKERLINPKTGISGRTAFEEDAGLGWGYVAAHDGDGIGFFNDTIGHDPTDKILKLIASEVEKFNTDTVRFYHLNGDEFAARGKNADDLETQSDKLQNHLESTNIEIDMLLPDGSRLDVNIVGFGISYGISDNYESADIKAGDSKRDREQGGKRAKKGYNPGGIEVVNPRTGRKGDLSERGISKDRALKVIEETGKPLSDAESEIDLLLDNANLTGSERLNILSKFRSGEFTIDDIKAAFPGSENKDDGDAPLLRKDDSISVTQYGNEFTTGKPVTFNYIHNKESATELFGKPDKDSPYGRGYEPSGKFVTVSNKVDTSNDQFESGEITFNNPIVVDNDNLGWKKTLSEEYGGKTGKALSKAIIADGIDGIVTVDTMNSGAQYVSEVVDLTSFDENIARYRKDDPKSLYVTHNLSAENLLHADNMGGIATPSLAITTVEAGFDDFGEISLIADKEIILDPAAKTFASDIYSPRYPTINYKIDFKKYNAVIDKINENNKDSGFGPVRIEVEDRGIADLYHDSAVKYAYLKEKNQAPKIKYKGKEAIPNYLKKFKGNSAELAVNQEFQEAAKKHFIEKAEKNALVMANASEKNDYDFWLKDNMNTYFDFDGRLKQRFSEELSYIVNQYHKPKQVDTYDLDIKMFKKLKPKNAEQEFKAWIEETFSPVVDEEKIFTGYTPSGNRKYIAHTLDNVVKIMNKKLRGGENFNYGVGTIRSAISPQFKTIKQIQNNRHNIIDSVLMKDLKEESSNEFIALVEKLNPYYKYDRNGFGYLDASAENLFDFAKGKGLPDYENVPTELMEDVRDFVFKLRDMPTAYFESKVQRAVEIDEFVAAVIPKDSSKKVKDLLRGKGLRVRLYDRKIEGDRARVISTMNNLLFVKNDTSENTEPGKFRSYSPESKTKTPFSYGRKQLDSLISELQKNHPGMADINFIVVDSQDQAFGKGSTQRDGKIKGGFYAGSNDIIIISENINNRADAMMVFRHEIVGHYGLRQILNGTNEFESLLGQVYAARDGELKDLYQWVAKSYPELVRANDGGKIADEMLARAAETEMDSSLLKDIWDAIVQMLRKIGLIDGDITRAEVNTLIRASRRNLQTKSTEGKILDDMKADPVYNKESGGVFYSQMQEVLNKKLSGKNTPKQYAMQINSMAKKGDFKAEELEWSGVNEWLDSLDSGKITKQEVIDFLKANEIQVEEVVKGEKKEINPVLNWLDDDDGSAGIDIDNAGTMSVSSISDDEVGYVIWTAENGKYYLQTPDGDSANQDGYDDLDLAKITAETHLEYEMSYDADADTKYESYTLPGGENYKELLLTLPANESAESIRFNEQKDKFEESIAEKYNVIDYSAAWDRMTLSEKEEAKFFQTSTPDPDSEKYKSGHWDEANVLATVRYNERTDADGNKVLFLEEIQSDFHQEGRKKGYKGVKPTDEQVRKFFELTDDANPADFRDEMMDHKDYGKVPNAPFKTTWPMLAMKRMIRHASENGFDSIAWTTGEQQAERYDLSKQISKIFYIPPEGTNPKDVRYITGAEDLYGNEIANSNSDGDINHIESIYGNEIAKKMENKEGAYDGGTKYELTGLDLKVGGEGMKGFYDDILPKSVNKYVKKWGGKVGETSIVQDIEADIMNGEEAGTLDAKVHSLKITDKMRDAAMSGQVLFKKDDQTTTPEFEKWFGKSQVVDSNGEPLVVYHGTNKDIKKFKGGRGGKTIWFAKDVDLANQFVGGGRRSMGGKAKKGSSVYPVYLSIKNPVNLSPVTTGTMLSMADILSESNAKSDRGALEKIAKESLDSGYAGVSNSIDDPVSYLADIYAEDSRVNDLLDNPALIKALSDAGHDGVKLIENFTFIYAAFEPTQIKSATGNTGQFDPNDPRIAFRREDDPTGGKFGLPEETALSKDRFVRLFQDSFNRVKKLQGTIEERGGVVTPDSDVYLAEELSSGKITAKLTQLENQKMKPLIKQMKADDISLEELDEYLMAKHAFERNAYIAEINDDMPDGGSGTTNAEASQILDGFSDRIDKFESAAKIVYTVNRDNLNTLVTGGHLDQETVNEWRDRWEFYVPLKGKEGADEGMGTGTGFSVGGAGIKSAMGRGAGNIAESPTLHTFAQAETGIVRTEKTKIGTALVNLIRDNPDPDLWTISERTYGKFVDLYGEPFEGYENAPEGLIEGLDFHRVRTITKAEREAAKLEGRKPQSKVVYKIDPQYRQRDDVFVVMDNGVELLINIKDKIVAEQLKRMNSNQLNAVLQGFGQVNRYLAMINTALNPEFVITNLERDFQTAMVNLSGEQSVKMAWQVTKSMPGAMRGIFQETFDTKGQSEWRDTYREMQEAGGTIGFFGLGDIDSKISGMRSKLKNSQTVLGRSKRGVETVRDLILDANISVENAARLAAFKVARDQWISNGMPEKEAIMKAASLSKNLTVNFNRKGELAPVLNSAYLFYNASIQGSARIITALKNPRVQKIAAGIAAVSFMNALYNAAMGGDDEDGIPFWDKISDYTKQTNIIFMHPDGSGNYTKVKLPYGYNVFWYAGTSVHDLAFDDRKSTGKVAMNMLSATMNAFNPLAGADFLDTITPTIIKPFEQDARNINFMESPIRPENPFYQYDQPDSQKAFKSTNDELKEMMAALNEASGGNETHAGFFDWSPETVKHYTSWLTGGAGMFVARTVGTGINLASGKDIDMKNVPFIRTLGGKPGSGFDVQRYYSAIKEVAAIDAQLKIYKDTDKFYDYEDENNEVRKLSLKLPGYKKKIKKLREKRDKAYFEGDNEYAKEISEEMRLKMADFSIKYDEAVEAQK